jgi:hypothetical protein
MTIAEPLIVVEHGQVLFFEDVITVESYLEPDDVTRGAYVVYDSTGRRLHPIVAHRQEDGPLGVPAEYITIATSGEDGFHPGELHALLVEHFSTSDDRDQLQATPLDTLVERGLAEARGTHEHGPLFIVDMGREIVQGLRSLIRRLRNRAET